MNRLHLTISNHAVNRFIPLLEKGVGLTIETGCTLRDLLCGQIGLSDEYLDHRIQTLFLNFRPVDDVDKTIINDGSTLALSSAMPGILGATMRKGGRYAPFRESISHKQEKNDNKGETGAITIKMFNMVAVEVGFQLLERGVEVDGASLFRVVAQFPGKLPESIKKMSLDGQIVDPEAALFNSLSKAPVQLTVKLNDENG
jgi:hypothetical protein